MSDDLDTARGFLRPPPGMESAEGYAAATAHAAVDAAETARAMHTTLEGILQAVDALVSLAETRDILSDPAAMAKIAQADEDIAAGRTITLSELRERMAPAHAPTGTAAGDPSPPPAAGDTPQVGDVWERVGGAHTRVVIVAQDWFGGGVRSGVDEDERVWRIDPANGWRRVSPAPAPLTEREVTAEAQAQGGVKPASDEDIARWSEAVGDSDLSAAWYTPQVSGLIARVRAEQATADNHKMRADRNAEILASVEAQREKAEAQVALMEPVVDLAAAPCVDLDRLKRAVRAYREATRDA